MLMHSSRQASDLPDQNIAMSIERSYLSRLGVFAIVHHICFPTEG
jgi:hypothetical protein